MSTTARAPLRLAGAVLLFAATASVAITVVHRRLEAAPRAGETITPSTPVEGVSHVEGPGRVLVIDSTPGGARVWLDGEGVGTTPWSSDWKCEDGKVVQLRIERSGLRPFTGTAACRQGTTRISATLGR
jgi:hypothetical protein